MLPSARRNQTREAVARVEPLAEVHVNKMRALSIRQPYVEQILRGRKRIEYRSRPTRIRGRFYLYASKSPGPPAEFSSLGRKPGELPTGMILGTVELVDCTKRRKDRYEWHLRAPRRLARTRRPIKHAQPVWFYPF